MMKKQEKPKPKINLNQLFCRSVEYELSSNEKLNSFYNQHLASLKG